MTPEIIIVGLGKTGLSCAAHMHRAGLAFGMMDTRVQPPNWETIPAQYPQIPLYSGGFGTCPLAQVKTLILSPGLSRHHPEILRAQHANPDVEIIGDIELFARCYQGPLVAITGSNGKSTVTSLVGAMAAAAGLSVGVGGNLGTPVLDLLQQQYPLYVLELSSFQLESTDSLKPSVATILNLSPDHLDHYASMRAYVAAKARIFRQAIKVVLNRDDPLLMQMVSEGCLDHLSSENILSFGLGQPLACSASLPPSKGTAPRVPRTRPPSKGVEEDAMAYGLLQDHEVLYLARGREKLLPVSALKLVGRHNIANALAALALAESVALPLPSSLEALKNFGGLPHRCEWVRMHQGLLFINDSKGTNVGATVATLEGLAGTIPGRWVLIAGGRAKNTDFSDLKKVVQPYCSALVLIGEATAPLAALFEGLVPCLRARTMEEAVGTAVQAAALGDGVLLSPSCTSLDMFRDFEARGDAFKEAVWALA